jgi:peptidoglycan/LPS O-acetylase OafA/YrhL
VNIKVRRAVLVLAILLLLALAWLGLQGGIQQWSQPLSPGQRIQTGAQFAYGLLALLAVASISRTGTFGRVVRVSWLVAITVAAGMAPVVWGDAAWGAGLVAGLAALLVGLLILWLLSAGARGLTIV